VLAKLDRHDDARAALDVAQQVAASRRDDELTNLIEAERERLS
jgi:hypothetical protein